MRGWCGGGIAASIMAPRVFQQETLPSGPTWDVVQEILDATSGDQPTTIRDHAILMVLAVYGVRSREVARLRLGDIDRQEETIVFTRAKIGGSQINPMPGWPFKPCRIATQSTQTASTPLPLFGEESFFSDPQRPHGSHTNRAHCSV